MRTAHRPQRLHVPILGIAVGTTDCVFGGRIAAIRPIVSTNSTFAFPTTKSVQEAVSAPE